MASAKSCRSASGSSSFSSGTSPLSSSFSSSLAVRFGGSKMTLWTSSWTSSSSCAGADDGGRRAGAMARLHARWCNDQFPLAFSKGHVGSRVQDSSRTLDGTMDGTMDAPSVATAGRAPLETTASDHLLCHAQDARSTPRPCVARATGARRVDGTVKNGASGVAMRGVDRAPLSSAPRNGTAALSGKREGPEGRVSWLARSGTWEFTQIGVAWQAIAISLPLTGHKDSRAWVAHLPSSPRGFLIPDRRQGQSRASSRWRCRLSARVLGKYRMLSCQRCPSAPLPGALSPRIRCTPGLVPLVIVP